MTAKLSGLADAIDKGVKKIFFDHIEKRLCAKDLFLTLCKILGAKKCFQNKPQRTRDVNKASRIDYDHILELRQYKNSRK